MSNSIHVVYIAGPFRGKDSYEIKRNIDKAEALALEVWRSGFACICPHLNTANFQDAAPNNMWLEGYTEILKRCDAILLTVDWQKSIGATEERRIALEIGIPVFTCLDDLKLHFTRITEDELKKWIAVDLDGTLTEYHSWQGWQHIGNPIPKMVERVKKWLCEGKNVRIFTARVSPVNLLANGITLKQVETVIDQWCKKQFGRTLPITHGKDMNMVELWDDRCVQVNKNTGNRADGTMN